ncbi:hypothetical protein [Pseudomonas sp. G(2018)]|uniref:hypothetical protein n=1 Tax=Pseudomonas sp. G(2018) TaxID=2502242 RepID=UPI0010F436A6|nr:hypothetical protein [Pseudomonas sp. G(2018)]
MLIAEYGPLALETTLVGSIMVFVSTGLIGLTVARLQRRYRINKAWAWIISILALLAVIALQGFFQVAEHLAPVVQPYMWLFGLMGFGATVVFLTLCLYTMFGGKASDLAKLFKRRCS